MLMTIKPQFRIDHQPTGKPFYIKGFQELSLSNLTTSEHPVNRPTHKISACCV